MEPQYTQDAQKAMLNQALQGINGFSLSSIDSHLGIVDAGTRNKVGPSSFVWPGPPSTVCHLLGLPIGKSMAKTLPIKLSELFQEVRDQIWRVLFERPIGLVPGEVRYEVKRLLGVDKNGQEKYKVYKLSLYSYQWESNRQIYSEATPLPQYDGRTQSVLFTWTTMPTEKQLHLIEGEHYDTTYSMPHLEPYFHSGLQSEVTPYIHHRGEGGEKITQIVNRALLKVTALLGIGVLQTCRQIQEEATEILYSTNTFVFDTEGRHPLPRPVDKVNTRVVEAEKRNFHGMTRREIKQVKKPPNQELAVDFQSSKTNQSLVSTQQPSASDEQRAAIAVKLMFDDRPESLRGTPMTTFLGRIGQRNASAIRRVRLEGLPRKGEVLHDGSRHPPSFSSILQTYALILKNACVNLRELTLDFEERIYGRGALKLLAIGAQRRKIDESAVEKLVETLPGLRKLQLGQYRWPSSDGDWSNELKLIAVVDKRKLEPPSLEFEVGRYDKDE